MIDLRSDTVTKPCSKMRLAMYEAEVGDDVFGEDPVVNELQRYAADYFGKEAALFCASGTQTNQIAINVHVKPGEEVITHVDSHVYKYEGGGIAKNSGASVRLLHGNRGMLKLDEIKEWINPDDVHYPVTRLVSLEDTSNRGGGAVYDFNEIKKISAFCKENDFALHLDGARLMNALTVNKINPKAYAAEFDSISLCLSKGLGAPVGSVLIGNTDFIMRARRVRKVLGGGMRQAGMIAAGGLFALKNNVTRLEEDHIRATKLANTLQNLDWVKELMPVETNIVVSILEDAGRRDEIIQLLAKEGIAVMAFGPGMIRMVTHLNFTDDDLKKTIFALQQIR